MKIGLLLFLLTMQPNDIHLAWDANDSEENVIGYRVHVGKTSGSYNEVYDAGNNTEFHYLTGTPGLQYFFAVSAYSAGPIEGPKSNEVSTTIPAQPCSDKAVQISVGSWSRSVVKNGTGIVTYSLQQSTSPITSIVIKMNGVMQAHPTGSDLRSFSGSYFRVPGVAGSYQLSVEAFDAAGCTDLDNRPMTVVVK